MINRYIEISRLRGGILFRLFLLVILATPATGQIQAHYICNNLNINTYGKSIQGKLQIAVTNESSTQIDSLTFVNWPAAYQQRGTFLAEEMLEDQNTSLRFAKPDELGYAGLTYSLENFADAQYIVVTEQFSVPIQLLPGETKSVYITFLAKLPHAKFNGFGYDAHTIRLSHFMPQIVPLDSSLSRPTLNSRNREAWFVPATYQLQLSASEDAELLTNLDIEYQEKRKWMLAAKTPLREALLLLAPEITHFSVPASQTEVNLHFGADFPAFNQVSSWQNVSSFLNHELGWTPPSQVNIAFFGKGQLHSSGNLFLLNPKFKQDEVEANLVEEIVEVIAREQLGINPAQHPWMVEGLANYYKHLYYERFYPNKKLLGPFSKTFAARFFDIDHYPIKYQNRMLFLYMARQGLDQPLADDAFTFSRANREAVIKGKSSLVYAYARSFVGDKNFRRAMHRWVTMPSANGQPEEWINNLNYFHNQKTNWLLGDLYGTTKPLDYSLKRTENCSYVYTATVKNKGKLVIPYSVTGYKDTNQVLTQWFEGHDGKKTVQIHLEDYTKVKIGADEAMPEVRQKNNTMQTTGLFKRAKPLRLQFYTSFDNPDRTQIFWLPSVKYNAYDQLLLGAQFYNSNLFKKPFEYRISPEFSTGTGTLTGTASFKFNWTPMASPFHLISFGMYGRYYHYDKNLAYFRWSPTLTFNFRKSHPRSPWINSVRLRTVSVDIEVPTNPGDLKPQNSTANYQIVDVRFKAEKGSKLTPFIGMFDLQFARTFSKISFDAKQRWRFSRHHLLTARLFAGIMHLNQGVNDVDDLFKFGLSGTQDYLFDYYFLGRSDVSGIWSQQMFVTDGGFKSQTNVFDRGMIAANLNVPFFRFFGAFGDVGYAFGDNNALYWDYGLYLEFIPDFMEVYFPIQSSEANLISQPEYDQQIRFVLNLNFDAIVNRVRRGLY